MKDDRVEGLKAKIKNNGVYFLSLMRNESFVILMCGIWCQQIRP